MILVKFSIVAFMLSIAWASLFGWGMLVRGFSHAPKGLAPVTVALGLSAILAFGGALNLAGIAFAPELWLVGGVGLVACATHIIPVLARMKLLAPSEKSGWSENALVSGFVVIVVGFAVATQLPPEAFNIHDDFQKYFAHPVRMLATGTLFGSPLSALGSETLGGQALLHAMVLSLFPIEYINGADAVFGLLLLMILGAAVGRRRLAPMPGALFAPLLIAIVNPQYVNVSTLYLGAALIAVSVLLTSDEREPDPPPVAGLGLTYGGLIALKPLFVLFVLLHLAATAVVSIIREHSLRPMLWVTRVGLTAGLAAAPWLLLYLPYYANFSAAADFSSAAASIPVGRAGNFDAFSIQPLFYGATAANYTATVGLALPAGLWGLIGWRRSQSPLMLRSCSGIVAAAITAFGCYAVLLFWFSHLLSVYDTALRYSIPFLLGIVPFIAVLACSRISFGRYGIGAAVPILALLVVSIGFIPSAIDRVRQAISYGSILAFTQLASSKPYLDYNHAALSSSAESMVRHMQDLIPVGEPFVAWIDQPFHLNFARNPIIDTEPAGLSTSWARVPPGTRFVLWQYRGFGVRSPQDLNARALGFVQMLIAQAKKGQRLYTDERFVVFRRSAE